MKYYVTFIALVVLLADSVIRNTFSFYVNLILFVLIVLVMFLSEFSIFKRSFETGQVFRSHSKRLNPFSIGLALIFTILYIARGNEYNLIFIVLIFWSIPFIELVMQFIYKKRNPVTLVIQEDHIIQNRPHLNQRNLKGLVDIKYDRFNKMLKLHFKSASKISIYTKGYQQQDLSNLLELLVQYSEHDVTVPENLHLVDLNR